MKLCRRIAERDQVKLTFGKLSDAETRRTYRRDSPVSPDAAVAVLVRRQTQPLRGETSRRDLGGGSIHPVLSRALQLGSIALARVDEVSDSPASRDSSARGLRACAPF